MKLNVRSICVSAIVWATVGLAQPPLVVTKQFIPSTIPPGGTTQLVLTFTNTSSTTNPIGTGSDVIPAGLTFGNPDLSGSCLGVISGNDNVNHAITFGGTLSPGTCVFTIAITTASLGVYTDGFDAYGIGGGDVGASATLTVSLSANPGVFSDAYQIGYAVNLNVGDSVVNLTNAGYYGGFTGAGTAGNLCVNAYAFDPQEEEIACCSCLVTPNGLNSLSVKNDLISNTLTPAVPTSVIIKLVATSPATSGSGYTVCNPAQVSAGMIAPTPSPNALAPGLTAWGSTLEPSQTAGTYNAVSVPFRERQLSFSEMNALTSVCNFIEGNGSGFGICKSCRAGALGGAKN